uniref:Uncharacterized protein n=1 Tax=Cacopsylla melanoneura TaxID=428564 RepID=A0A8D8ZBU5_9HEMI
MANSGDQRLFQIEIQVGGIKWNRHIQSELEDGVVCATFQMLDYPPMEICSDEFCAYCQHTDVQLKSGKMMLFVLTQDVLTELHNNFIVHIKVIKMTMKAGKLPFRTEIASSEMNISNDFTSILSTCFQPQTQYPTSKFIKDEIDLQDKSGVALGAMNTFIRLLSLGRTFMGHMYAADSDEDTIMIETDSEAQALVTHSDVKACPKRYINLTSTADQHQGLAPVYREHATCAEDNNMMACRLYKLDIPPPKEKPNKSIIYGPPQYLEQDTVLMKGAEVMYEPNPDYVKNDNPTRVYYRMTNSSSIPTPNQTLQFIPPPTEEPVSSIGPITGLPPDGKVDVFVLRIVKKKFNQPLRTHLEIEVRTPKFVSRKKEKFENSMQYDKKDLAPKPA